MTYWERVRFFACRKRVSGAGRSSFWWMWLLIINKQLRLVGKREKGLELESDEVRWPNVEYVLWVDVWEWAFHHGQKAISEGGIFLRLVNHALYFGDE